MHLTTTTHPITDPGISTNHPSPKIGSQEKNDFIDCIEATIYQKLAKSSILHRMGEELAREKAKETENIIKQNDWNYLADEETLVKKEKGKGIGVIISDVKVPLEPYIYTILKTSDKQNKPLSSEEIDKIAKEILSCSDVDLLSSLNSNKNQNDIANYKVQYTNECYQELEKKAQIYSVKASEYIIDRSCIRICRIIHLIKSNLQKLQEKGKTPPSTSYNFTEVGREYFLKNMLETIKKEKLAQQPYPRRRRSQSHEVKPISTDKNKEFNRNRSSSSLASQKLSIPTKEKIEKDFKIFHFLFGDSISMQEESPKETKRLLRINLYNDLLKSLRDEFDILANPFSKPDKQLKKFVSVNNRADFAPIFGGDIARVSPRTMNSDSSVCKELSPQISPRNQEFLKLSLLINQIFRELGENLSILEPDDMEATF